MASWSATLIGDDWCGLLKLTAQDDGLNHVVVTTEATSPEVALEAVTDIYDILAGERERYLRRSPEVTVLDDFDTKKSVARGFVRFSFRGTAGEEIKTVSTEKMHGFGKIGME